MSEMQYTPPDVQKTPEQEKKELFFQLIEKTKAENAQLNDRLCWALGQKNHPLMGDQEKEIIIFKAPVKEMSYVTSASGTNSYPMEVTSYYGICKDGLFQLSFQALPSNTPDDVRIRAIDPSNSYDNSEKKFLSELADPINIPDSNYSNGELRIHLFKSSAIDNVEQRLKDGSPSTFAVGGVDPEKAMEAVKRSRESAKKPEYKAPDVSLTNMKTFSDLYSSSQ